MCIWCILYASESDPHSYKATKAVVKKAQKNISEASTGFEPSDLHYTGAMLYQLSYEA